MAHQTESSQEEQILIILKLSQIKVSDLQVTPGIDGPISVIAVVVGGEEAKTHQVVVAELALLLTRLQKTPSEAA